MANYNNKQPNKTQSGTNIQEVRQQNAQSAGGAGAQYGTEFASETDVAEVKQRNQQSQANKNAGKGNYGQQ
jgi:small acid-soluble spore protein E (minor gamma-type SASP)